MKTTTTVAIGILVAAAAVGAGIWWGRRVNVVQTPAPAATQAQQGASVASSAPASGPTIAHPVPTSDSIGEADQGFGADFAKLLKRDTIAALLRSDDFDRRFVATVDNLGRTAAPASAWPVAPAQGRFTVSINGDEMAIDPDNGRRYAPYVLALEHVDLHEAIRAYVWHYAELQHKYEELGFPGHYFNDRFVDVLDQLLATPDPATPPHVHLPNFEGTPPTHPWVLYEFDDPELRALSAGQRLLLRMGPANERRVKVRLAELRRLLASSPSNKASIEQARDQLEAAAAQPAPVRREGH